MAVTYSKSQDLEQMGAELVAQYHSELVNAHIVYLLRSEPAVSKGQTKLGTARKVSGLPAALCAFAAGGEDLAFDPAEGFFVIEISQPHWAAMPDKMRRALVDHELEHCHQDLDGKLYIVGHDLEEFASIVKRHGPWEGGIAKFLHSAQEWETQQLKLVDA